jgi:hypothetical protein
MGLFDNVTANLNAIAGKVGMTPDQVTALTNTLQSKMTEMGGDKMAAIQAAATQHGIPVDKVQEILNHGGGGDLAEQAKGVIGGLFKKN